MLTGPDHANHAMQVEVCTSEKKALLRRLPTSFFLILNEEEHNATTPVICGQRDNEDDNDDVDDKDDNDNKNKV